MIRSDSSHIEPASSNGNPMLREKVKALELSRSIRVGSSFAFRRWLVGAAILASLAFWLWHRYRDTLEGRNGGRPAVAPPAATHAGATPAARSETEATSKSGAATSPTASISASNAGGGKIVLESKGYLVPAHQILVSPKVTGMVVRLNVEEGRRVNKGDVLAELESTEYQRDLERAQASLELAKAQLQELENGSRPEEISQGEAELAQAQEELVDLERNYKRNRRLAEQNNTTEQELQRSESLYLATLRRIDRLKFALELLRKGPRTEKIAAGRAAVGQAAAEVGKAQWRLDNCKILAPLSGTILKKNAEEGNIVNPMAFNGSFSLCDLADLSDLEVDLAIQERDVKHIFVGQRCRIRAEAYSDRLYDGFVSRLMPIADRAKGAVPVRVKVRVPAAEEGQYLKPEMGAVVSFYDVRMDGAAVGP